MDTKISILIVDDDPGLRETISEIISPEGYVPIGVATGKAALDRVEEEMPAVALIDLRLEDMPGIEVMGEIKERSPATECIVLTGYASQASAIEAVNLGAYGYVQKPYDMEQLLVTIRRAIEKREAEEALRESEARYRAIVEDQTELICRFRPDGALTFVNEAYCRYFGKKREELIGHSFTALVFDVDQEFVEEQFASLSLENPVVTYEHRVMLPDGQIRWQQWSDRAIFDEQGSFIEFQSVGRDITEQVQAEEQLVHIATHDVLTGLPNRRLFNDRLNLELAHAHRNQRGLAVMLLDLDHFKEVNDTLGHSVGDKLLRVVGNRLMSLLRQSDTVARMGGDEFMLLLPEIAQEEDAVRIARKVLEAIRKPYEFDGHKLHVTTSIGIAMYPEDGEDSDTLMKNADIAMYRAKDGGRDNYQGYTPSMNAKALE